jgi:hypothetical protein
MIDDLLKDYIGKFVTIYLDNIIVYSKSFEEYIKYIKKVLGK